MRLELPPVSRLVGPNGHQERLAWSGGAHQALAEAEERLKQLVSRQSLGRLAEALADPLLKLDEVNSGPTRDDWLGALSERDYRSAGQDEAPDKAINNSATTNPGPNGRRRVI